VPNEEKVDEIETYPLFLEALRKELGDKILSIAVPGRKQDFIAFTEEQGPKIWKSVDMVNVMSYDLTNRRDNITNHASGVQGSLDTINEYLAIGADPQKLNLGFAYYAKWFTTNADSDCDENPLGCELACGCSAQGSERQHRWIVWIWSEGQVPIRTVLQFLRLLVCYNHPLLVVGI
jgi:chitinase